MRLVIVESPYAGDVAANVTYARACVRDALERVAHAGARIGDIGRDVAGVGAFDNYEAHGGGGLTMNQIAAWLPCWRICFFISEGSLESYPRAPVHCFAL